MSDSRYRFARRTRVPPDVVLAAIRHAAFTAKRGDLPAPLQRGNRGLRGAVRRDRFTLWFDMGDSDQTSLVGMVVPAPGGGSEVNASAVDARNGGVTLMLLVGLAVVVLIAGGGQWWLLFVAAAGGLVTAVRRGLGIINHAQAAYLVNWLNAVLDGAEAPKATSANDPALPGIPV